MKEKHFDHLTQEDETQNNPLTTITYNEIVRARHNARQVVQDEIAHINAELAQHGVEGARLAAAHFHLNVVPELQEDINDRVGDLEEGLDENQLEAFQDNIEQHGYGDFANYAYDHPNEFNPMYAICMLNVLIGFLLGEAENVANQIHGLIARNAANNQPAEAREDMLPDNNEEEQEQEDEVEPPESEDDYVTEDEDMSTETEEDSQVNATEASATETTIEVELSGVAHCDCHHHHHIS